MARYRVTSYEEEQFADREDAGRVLAQELKEYAAEHPLILGIPRGGVCVAKELARLLGGELDVVLTHKIGAPSEPEVAMGAVTESGRVFLSDAEEFAPYREYAREEAKKELVVLKRRVEGYRKILPAAPLKGRIVIVTDDGVATGFTMQAALWAARQDHPKRLIAAIPVLPREMLAKLARVADETICLKAPESFMSVGQFYMNFDVVQDTDVLKVLEQEAIRRAHAAGHRRQLRDTAG